MAIEDLNSPQATTPVNSPAPAPFQPGGASASASFNSSNPFGFTGVSLTPGRLNISPIRNQIGGEQYEKLNKELRELMKENNTNSKLEIRVHMLDRSVDPNLHFIGFVIAAQSLERKELGVGYNVMLLEATGEPLTPVKQTFQNEAVEIPRFAETAADAQLEKIVHDLMARTYGNVPLYKSDAQVVPTSFDPESKDAVRNLASNAANAATTSLVMFAGNGQFFTKDFDLVAELKNNPRGRGQGDADLSFITVNNPAVVYDHVNNAIRASLVVHAQTGYRKDGNNTRSVNDGTGPKTILETAGYIDLMPRSPRQLVPMYNPQMTYGIDQRRLAPVFIIKSPISNFSFTPSAQLLNVLVAADLAKGAAWARAFSRRGGVAKKRGDLDLTDVTAITIDFPDPTNPGQPTPRPDVGELSFSDEKLMTFLGTYCYQELTLAMDIPVAAPSTWYLSLFAMAAKGTPTAIDRVQRSMNDLTGGKFFELGGNKLSPFENVIHDVEYGYWEDPSAPKQYRSSDEVDYVAVANYADAQNNPELLERWTNSWLQVNRDRSILLAERRAIMREILGPSLTFTGRALRVYWKADWVTKALQALAAAGITTSSDSQSGYSFGPQRAYAEFLSNTGLGAGATWTNATGGGAAGFGYGGMFSTPWGL